MFRTDDTTNIGHAKIDFYCTYSEVIEYLREYSIVALSRNLKTSVRNWYSFHIKKTF